MWVLLAKAQETSTQNDAEETQINTEEAQIDNEEAQLDTEEAQIDNEEAQINTEEAQDVAIFIVTGPIIGRVTTTTARVLLEFNTQAPITVILTDQAGNQTRTSRIVNGSIPVPFSFENLQPNTRYSVSLNDSTIDMTQSYFTTLSDVSGKLNFGTLSCNDKGVLVSLPSNADLWDNMLRRIQNNEIDYLILSGDQVYMDDPYGKGNPEKPYEICRRILSETPRSEWDTRKPEMLEVLRNEYRRTWNIPSIKETLSKIPTLTILDDHEVRDDWGYLPGDYDPTTADYFYGQLARQVYYEYQRQLREDIDFGNLSNITQEYYYETLNDIGFFFIDYRGIRTWNRNYSEMAGTQLGLTQTRLLQQVLNPNNGTFANLNNFFLVTPLTFVFLVEKLVKIGYFSSNDAQESWSYAYKEEQAQILELLRSWKLAKSGRQVTILDGDVHMGGYTNIYYQRDFAFLQFTTSSIASSAPSDAIFLGFDLIKEVEPLVGSWSYEHHDWTNDFNYGIVRVKTEDSRALADCYLVEVDGSSDEEPEVVNSKGKRVRDEEWQEILQDS